MGSVAAAAVRPLNPPLRTLQLLDHHGPTPPPGPHGHGC